MNTQIDLEQFRRPVLFLRGELLYTQDKDGVAECDRLLSIIDSAKVAHEISAPTGGPQRAWTEQEKADCKAALQRIVEMEEADPLVEWANSPLNFTATVGVFKDGVQPAAVVDDGGLSRSLKLAAAEQQAEAWQAVCSLLDEIRPGWLLGNGSGITRALDTIRELSFPVEDAAVAVDDVMVERATRAFMETHRPELEHSIRAALAAALSSAPGM